jgi:large-conductance mechanosensitive channel
VKFISGLKKKEEVVEVKTEPVEDSLSVLKEIRDSLKK